VADPGANAVAAAVPPSVAMVLTQARLPMAASTADLRHPVQNLGDSVVPAGQLGERSTWSNRRLPWIRWFRSIGRTICPLMRGIN